MNNKSPENLHIEESDNPQVLDFTARLGCLMLENGAEISRVEETMERVSSHFGVNSKECYVLINGIFATGRSFSRTIFVPFKGTQRQKIAEANQLSRDIGAGLYSLSEAEAELSRIENMKMERPLVQVLASAIGSGCFCAIFGGSLLDCAAAFINGMIIWIGVIFAGRMKISKIFCNVLGGALGTTLCLLMYKLGLGNTLSLMLVGSLIPLVPGVQFTNGIKDICNEDYLAGSTRLLDALLVFFCIAMGVSIVLVTYSHFAEGMISL